MNKLLTSFLIFIFSTTLTLLTLTAGFKAVFSDPNTIKTSIDSTGVYEVAVDELIESTSEVDNQNESLPLKDPGIRTAANEAFPPSFIKTTIEDTIDTTYTWLRGETEQLKISIDFEQNKQKFATSSANYAAARYEQLPACQPEQLASFNGTVDPLTVTCQVPNVTADTIRQQAQNELTSNNDFLQPIEFSSQEIENTEGIVNAKDLPGTFQLLNRLPVFLTIMTVALAALIIAIYRKHNKGLTRIAGSLISVAILGGLTVVVLRVFTSRLPNDSEPLQAAGGKVVQQLVVKFTESVIIYSLVYLAIGLTLLVATKIYVKRQNAAINYSSKIRRP